MSIETKQEQQVNQSRSVAIPIQPDMVTDSQSQAHGFEQTTKECIWALGSVCFGDKFETVIFSGQLRVPMCQHHLDGHRVIMTLASNMTELQRNVAIERMLSLSEDERLKIVRARNLKLVPWSEV